MLESLSVDEDKYIKVSIKKAYLKFIRDNFKDLKMKEYSIEDVNIQDKLPIIEEKYFYENLYRVELWNLEHKYSKKQQDSLE